MGFLKDLGYLMPSDHHSRRWDRRKKQRAVGLRQLGRGGAVEPHCTNRQDIGFITTLLVLFPPWASTYRKFLSTPARTPSGPLPGLSARSPICDL